MTLQQLEEGLSKIGYSIKGKYPNRFIYNNLGKRVTPVFRVWDDRIDVEIRNDETRIYFSFKNCNAKYLNGLNALSIGNNYHFIILYKV